MSPRTPTLEAPVARNSRQTIVFAFKYHECHIFLGCRLFITNAEGQSVPTAKGVTVGIVRLPRLPDFVYAVAQASLTERNSLAYKRRAEIIAFAKVQDTR